MELDKIYCADSNNMKEVKDNSVQLIVTSPPYNVQKPYENHSDNMPLEEYLKMLNGVWKECKRVLCDGGRICVNIANTWRNPYLPLHSYIIQQLVDLGFLMRGEIIWDKGASVGTSTAWGSWKSPSNPTLRDVHEYIMIFSKSSFGVSNNRENDLTKEEFLEFTKSIWAFPTISAKKIGHPAPFPEELPRRIIKLYTFPNDVVLDPFMGAGTTAIAAKKLKRHYIGYDISKEYCKLAEKRIDTEFSQTTLKQLPKIASKKQ
jgi:modification methylase